MREKLYTVAEANAILPEVRRLVERMLRARAEIVQLQPTLWPAVQAAVFNGGSKSVSQASRQILIIQDIIRALQLRNILVKDINTGLIDFPAERNGQLVLLCWQYDEPAVQFWHDVDRGFAGRQRIEDGF
jgi:hypothetical protein